MRRQDVRIKADGKTYDAGAARIAPRKKREIGLPNERPGMSRAAKMALQVDGLTSREPSMNSVGVPSGGGSSSAMPLATPAEEAEAALARAKVMVR